MPIFDAQGREAKTIPEMRRAVHVPDGECLGCYLGDAGVEMHDIPDACEFFGGFVYDLDLDT